MPESTAAATAFASLLARTLLAIADPLVPVHDLSAWIATLLPGTRVDIVVAERPSAAPRLLVTTAEAPPAPPERALCDAAAFARWLAKSGYQTVEMLSTAADGQPATHLFLARPAGLIDEHTRDTAYQLAHAFVLRQLATRREAETREARAAMVAATARAEVAKQLTNRATVAIGSVHDLGNTLGLIQGLAELLQPEAPPEVRGDLEQIVVAAQDGGHIARRALGRHSAAHAIGYGVTDLAAVVEETLALTRPVWDHDGCIKARSDVAAGHAVRAEAADVREVLINLMLNAVAAMPHGGRITFRSRYGPGYIVLEVADTGVGIAPEHIAAIFEPGHTSRPGSSGLGLAISRALVEQTGGTLTVQSEPGRGATFMIRLPSALKADVIDAKTPARAVSIDQNLPLKAHGA